MKSDSIISAVQSVTGKWAKQRKAEERNANALYRRKYCYSDRVNFSDIAETILPEAYAHASGDGRLTVSQRQVYYAAREEFKAQTGREIDYSYFSQTILRQYLNRHDPGWKITADPRGTFSIPNCGHEKNIPVGTIQIDEYLRHGRLSFRELESELLPIEWPLMREGQRYAAVLYIEKEGFGPLLKEARIAEKFDLAILSCKGQSVVAARKLVDHVCAKNDGVPLFVLHDFDKAGFEIAASLTEVSGSAEEADRVAYHFKNEINVTDLGLRLADVEKYKLQSERCKFKGRKRPPSATNAEFEFLKSDRRVELNAFTAPQFVEWLEGKLSKHLPQRLIPSDDILEKAYRRSMAVAAINTSLKEIIENAVSEASEAKIPKSLKRQVVSMMKKTGTPWDIALHSLMTGE